MDETSLAWRVEETCLNACPALRTVLFGDWLLRFAEGVTRRANSANPRAAAPRDIKGMLAASARLYAAQGLPVLVRVPSLADPVVERRLDRLGYRAEGETVTLWADRAAALSAPDPEVEVLVRPSADWLVSMAAAQAWTERQAATYRRIVDAVALPAAFVGLRAEGRLAALAYGAVHDGLLCCESVVTHADHRGRGYARRMLAALVAWAGERGVEGVCLQVEATNAPARALYRSLGLEAELYRYHYRRGPESGASAS